MVGGRRASSPSPFLFIGFETRDSGDVVCSGEALYAGRDMGTVEAALASGREMVQPILVAEP
jgi:hypothetical protein